MENLTTRRRWDFLSLKEALYKDSEINLVNMDRDKHGNIRVDLQCGCGDVFNCQLSSYYAGQKKCPKCSRGNRDLKRRKKWEEIVEFANDKGNRVISTEEAYVNNRSKLWFSCSECDSPFESSWSSYLSTKRNTCRKCTNLKKRKSTDEVESELNKFGYTLVSKEYIGNQKPLEIKCPNGHIVTTTFNQFQQGIRCKYCKK